MKKRTILKGAFGVDGRALEIAIQDGRFSEFTSEGSIAPAVDDEVIDLDGRTISPSFVDLHTHLREPGKEDAETVASGSAAAVRGGFGAISAMPNTTPVADTAGVVEQVYSLGQEAGLCDVFPIGAVTVGQAGERLAEILAMAESRAKVRVFSDDGHCVADPVLMRRALEYVKIFDGVIAQHAQEPGLTSGAQMNEGIVSAKLGLKGWPAVAEEAIIARDVLLADHVDSRLHVCHVSTAGSVEILRWAKKRGINVSAEVTPHHLLLTEDLATSYDPVYKVNPPLRSERDVHALREGLADGTIDIIATDHAPHTDEAKECEWDIAAFGMIGLETALAISYKAMVETGMITFERLVESLTRRPAEIAGYRDYLDPFQPGAPASFTVIDRERKWTIDRERVISRSKNTPFNGMQVQCYVDDVMFRGKWTLRAGTVLA
jgi:dihydroorotase